MREMTFGRGLVIVRWLTGAVAVLAAAAPPAEANGFARTLVLVPEAVVYSSPSTTAGVQLRLHHGDVVQVRKENADWCDVMVPIPAGDGRTVNGWMRTADLVRSEGMAAFWNKQFDTAVERLAVEVRDTTDPVVGSWLQFFLGYSQWATGRVDLARATFDTIAKRRPAVPFAAHAYVVIAKIAWSEREPAPAIAAYEQMLTAFPGYRGRSYRCDLAVAPYPLSWTQYADVCGGDGLIPGRLEAARKLSSTLAATAGVVSDPRAPGVQKAEAWLSIGRAWEAKIQVDPGRVGETGVQTTEAREAYEAAVAAAPRSEPAGSADWRLIALTEPYEWEGDLEAQAAWNIEQYGSFREKYPAHVLNGEALFRIAKARWAQAGYPEVYNHFSATDRARWEARRTELGKWFDVSGFGGGVGGAAIVPRPEQTTAAIELFRELIAKYPATESAPMAQYYIAVILDYCRNSMNDARAEYETFIRKYPKAEPFVSKARQRLR